MGIVTITGKKSSLESLLFTIFLNLDHLLLFHMRGTQSLVMHDPLENLNDSYGVHSFKSLIKFVGDYTSHENK